MITFHSIGKWDKTFRFLNRNQKLSIDDVLEREARKGVNALKSATPVRTGLTANSWTYEIERGRGNSRIIWSNTNTNGGYNIAIILQYGHGTGTGGYVSGIDYINPAIRPVFDDIANTVWKEVIRG